MVVRTTEYFVRASGASCSGPADRLVARVVTDSRQVREQDLFVALPGDKFDGHDFLPEAARKGAVAVMVETGRPVPDLPGCAILTVDNTRAALGRMGAAYRQEYRLPVIAVCGSNGKTTTKELIASVLRQTFHTLWSEASFNNDIGVPLTLMRLESAHQAAVLEAGTNHPGELARLLQMIKPRFGVLTNIAREHLEFFGDLAGVAREEGALAECLEAEGTLLLNGDDPWSEAIAARTRARVLRVGVGEHNDWRASGVRLDSRGARFKVHGPEPRFSGEYRINLLGRHQVPNALFAIALGQALGMSPTEIERGLVDCKPPKMRLQSWEANGVRVLNDAYNANADSVAAALNTLLALPCKGRRVAVLGDMAELGSYSQPAHEEVGREAARMGVGQLFAVGKMAPVMGQSARKAGLNRVFEFADVESAGAALRNFLKPGDLVLLKASRATGLERVVDMLQGSECFTT